MILDTSILQSKGVSSTKCDSFKKLHISFIDGTVFASNPLSRLLSNIWAEIFSLASGEPKEGLSAGFFFERCEGQFGNFVGYAPFFTCLYLSFSFAVSVYLYHWRCKQNHSLEMLIHIKDCASTIFHLDGSYFLILSKICGKLFLYSLLDSGNLISSWVRSICGPW